MPGAALFQIGPSRPGTAAALAALLAAWDLPLGSVSVLPPDLRPLEAALRLAAARPEAGLVLTLGAAGPWPGHTAPDALGELLSRPLPGMEAALRAALPPAEALLFRGTAGLRGGAVLANLPPPPWAEAALAAILPGVRQVLDRRPGP